MHPPVRFARPQPFPPRSSPTRGVLAAIVAVTVVTVFTACHDDPLRPRDLARARADAGHPSTALPGALQSAPDAVLTWYLASPTFASPPTFTGVVFGAPGDLPTPADYDGDGRTDVATRRADRPGGGTTWYLQRSSDGFAALAWGLATDSAVAADYDGDGRADVAVWRPADGVWWVYGSASSRPLAAWQFGQTGDVPVPGRYTHDSTTDRRVDYAVWRPSTGMWYVAGRDGATTAATQLGQAGDVPVPGDYDGDGRTDLAVWRPGTGTWYVLRSRDGFLATQFGQAGDLPVPADYDGDGRVDPAVRRPTGIAGATQAATWYVLASSTGFRATEFGYAADAAVPGRYAGARQAQLASVRVTQAPVASLSIAPDAVGFLLNYPGYPNAGAPVQLAVTARDAAGTVLTGRAVTWTSSAPAVAVVDAGGLVSPVGDGQAVVTATSEGVSASVSVEVHTWTICPTCGPFFAPRVRGAAGR